MIIDCVADLHGHYPKLDGGDLLIVAGDLTARDEPRQYDIFFEWLTYQKYRFMVVIAGNHDNFLQKVCSPALEKNDGIKYDKQTRYLCDSGTEFEGLKIWGSPWTKTFKGMNPHCKAFTCDTEEELAEKWRLIPEDTDILITHSPPVGFLDYNIHREACGSISLRNKLMDWSLKKHPQLMVYGHIHEGYGQDNFFDMKVVNASHVNERYEPVNKPIRVIL